MKKRDYRNINNLSTLLHKECLGDFLRACDSTQGTAHTMHPLKENMQEHPDFKPKAHTMRTVAPVKSVGAKMLATDIYKGMLKEFKELGAGVFVVPAEYTVKARPITIILNAHGFTAQNNIDTQQKSIIFDNGTLEFNSIN